MYIEEVSEVHNNTATDYYYYYYYYTTATTDSSETCGKGREGAGERIRCRVWWCVF